MDELIDIIDEKGNTTGKTCLKSEAHRFGYFHATVHVWLHTNDAKLLLQKRALTKKVFPGLWDISVAGHVAAGEKINDAALREIKEEIGLDVQPKNLIKIGTRNHHVKHSNGIIDNEFHHVFISELTVPVEQLTIQKGEVEALKLFDLSILNNTTAYKNVLLPQFSEYYNSVYKAIKLHIN